MALFCTATLPENFAYLIRSFSLELVDTRAADWDAVAELRMFNHIPGQPLGTNEHMAVLLRTMGAAAAPVTARLIASPIDLHNFSGPVWAVHGGSITFRVSMVNTNATVTLGGTLTSHLEFFEYDLTQAQRYWINTPIPVISR